MFTTSFNENIHFVEIPVLPQQTPAPPPAPAPQPAAKAPLARPTIERVEQQLDQIDALWDLMPVDRQPEIPAPYEIPKTLRLSVVIPVYNERATVLEVIARVRALPVQTEIIVVDDGSTDGTRGWLETIKGAPGLKLIMKARNEGKGAALRTGFAAATGDIVVVQDADLEYDPRDLLEVIRPLIEGRADVAYGSRFSGRVHQDRSLAHRMINRMLTECSNLFTGLRLSDMETCYKAFRRGVLRDLNLRQDRFGFEPEVTAKLARRRYRIAETPIRYQARSYRQGKKIGVRDAFNAMYCIVRYGIAD